MAGVIFGFFTVILVLDCILLIAFVLVQLPKKEAGAGMAFGGAATDALFGAGSGSAVTVITKYLAGVFFGLSLIMAIMTSSHGQNSATDLEKALSKTSGAVSHPITEPASSSSSAAASNNSFMEATPPSAASSSNAGTTAPATGTGALPSLELQPATPSTNK